MTRAGFPHSDTPGSQLGCQLPRAYRRLQRPSSALDAKASTMCPSQLVSTTSQQHKPLQHHQDNTMNQTQPTHPDNQRSRPAHNAPAPTTPQQEGPWPGTKDARVHYADLKQQPHQGHPTHTRGRDPQGGPETPTHQRLTPPAMADPSGPNSVFNHVPTNVRPMTSSPALTGRSWQSTFH